MPRRTGTGPKGPCCRESRAFPARGTRCWGQNPGLTGAAGGRPRGGDWELPRPFEPCYSGQCRVHSLLPSVAGGEEAAVAFTWVHTTGLCRALGPRGRPGEGACSRLERCWWGGGGGGGVQPLSLQPLGREPTSGVSLAPFQLTR